MLRPFARRAFAAVVLAALSLSAASCTKKTPEERVQEAQQLLQDRQVPLAVLKLKELVNEAPEDPATINARYMLAQVYESLGRKENIKLAVEQYKAIYKKVGIADPRGIGAHQRVTDALAASGELAEALAHAKEGVEATKDGDELTREQMQLVYSTLLLSQEDEAKQAEGIGFLKKLMAESKDVPMRGASREQLAQFYRMSKKFAESSAVYDEYIKAHPDDKMVPQLVIGKSFNERLAGNADAAKKLFDEGAAAYLKQIDGELDQKVRAQDLNSLSQYYAAMGDLDTAEKMLRRIMSENVGKRPAIEAQFAIGEMFMRSAQFDKAIAHFQQIEKENPNSQLAETAKQAIGAATQFKAEYEKQKAEALKAADGQTSGTATPAPTPAAP